MNLLLDINIIIDICARRSLFYTDSFKAINKCQQQGWKVWLYVGSVQTIEYNLAATLKKEDKSFSFAQKKARMILELFSKQFNWLAALADDGNVLNDKDPEDAQLYKAVQRLDNGFLLTRDEGMLKRGDYSISPEQYLKLNHKNKSIPFIDLDTQQSIIRPKLETRIHNILHHGKYIMGPEVQELEDKLAEFVGVKYCIGVSSGTDALLIAMMSLGIKQGDEVITTPFTFIATSEMIALLGAKPVFVDIDPKTYNIDPNKIEQAITKKTKAIMPVSLYGQCVDFDKINSIADKYQLPVIEDGAQSLGATYKGKQSCSLTTIACTSFFPSKPLGAYGEGGACFTNDDKLAKLMREIRVHGQDKRYHHPRIGINGRLDTIQAGILLAKLEVFPEEVEKRQIIGDTYTQLINTSGAEVIPPYIEKGNTSVYAQYTIQVNNRGELIQWFKENNIPIAVHYPIPINQQPALKTNEFELANAENLSNQVMSLPMHPYLTEAEQQCIVDILK